MYKHASPFVVLMVCTAVGCQSVNPGPKVSAVSPVVSRQAPAIVTPSDRPDTPATLRPKYVHIALRQANGDMPALESRSMYAGQGEQATEPVAHIVHESVREVTGVMADLQAIPQAAVSMLASTHGNVEEMDKATPARPISDTSVNPSRTWISTFVRWAWSYAGPLVSALCIYIIAPLLVDLIKQRIQVRRKPLETV